MTDKFYVVYHSDEVWVDNDWSYVMYEMMDKYFTDEDQAELCADYLGMIGSGDFFVQEVTSGDDIDYRPLIEEVKKKEREERMRRAKKVRSDNVECYALYKSRIDGSDFGDNLREFKNKYADYIENGN